MNELMGQSNKNQKWTMLCLMWLTMFVSYLDRVNIAVAGPTMMHDLNMSPWIFGSVLSSFTFGYALIQIPGGYLADKFGAKRMMLIAIICWSIFTGLTGVVSSVSLLIAVRVLFGIGEGIALGAQFKLVADYFSSEERSSANAFFLTALAIGPAFVGPIAAWIIGLTGWRELFLYFTIPGLVMAVLLFKFLPEKPVAGVVHTEILNKHGSKAGWKDIVTYPTVWLLFFTYMFFNIAFWGFLLWIPSYLSLARHIELKTMGFYASMPYIFGFFGMIILGWLGNKIMKHQTSLVAVGYLMTGFALYVAFTQESALGCLAALSCAGFFLYGGFGPFWATAQDQIPDELRATFSGFVNFGGQIGGFFAPIVVGAIVSFTGSFWGGFLFLISGLILAAGMLFILQILSARSRILR
ncbi:Hypothetical protein LUCI_3014 [Lucifera butyrica]|uniref:Major facilitator superfamily (MFS) profile domain-containing protein n=1 Tax=Lucifera butyrica TaxID=1351585 RepID=A0A498R9A1_9FIRM|nr:MFS transporter [Lucifera butyrica]VBB07749.1 Hypothetical protein LUCI_3014 [Lucifera butyrica]